MAKIGPSLEAANMPSDPQKPRFTVGDPCPQFSQRTQSHPNFCADALAGRYLVLCFYGSAADPAGRAAIEAMQRHRSLFDDRRACFFGVSVDRRDEAEGRVAESLPGVRFLWDFDSAVSRLFGAVSPGPTGQLRYRRFWLVIDPTLHILANFPFAAEDGHKAVFDYLARLPEPAKFAGFELPPPVLILPNVLGRDLCRQLIDLYESNGGTETGVMRDGANLLDPGFKRRKDYGIKDPDLIGTLGQHITRRVIPEILRLFFINAVYIERYIIGCYDARDGAHFAPHRDNGPGFTVHRRFAVSINLNGDFEGGELRFPEYTPRGFKTPPGWALVFPCGILHQVLRVRKGRRYAFLPFVYDEAGARLREAQRRGRDLAPSSSGSSESVQQAAIAATTPE